MHAIIERHHVYIIRNIIFSVQVPIHQQLLMPELLTSEEVLLLNYKTLL